MVVDLDLGQSEHNEYTVVTVGGEVDVYTAPKLRDLLSEILDGDCDKLCVDLTGVQFLDSTGLGVLVGTMRRIEERDGSMVVICERPHLLKVFEITGLSTWFDIRTSLTEI